MRRFWLAFGLAILFSLLFTMVVSADPSAPGGSRTRMEQQNTGWLRGHTSVSDLTWAEKMALLGHRTDKPVLGPHARQFVPHLDPAKLPRKLDWRDHNGDFVTGVRDQEDCGSCYVFSALGAMEANWAIRLGMTNPTIDLSEQFGVSCQSLMGCNGGWASEILNAACDEGIPNESCMRYDAYDTACNKACDDWALRTAGLDSYEVVLNDVADTPEEYELIMQALQEGPVTVAFTVYDDFFDYEYGIYRPWGAYAGSHAVVIVGYDADSQYWIVKNSWGSGWGENGYFRIAWGYSEMGSETYLPVPPPCTNAELYIRPESPRQNFFFYSTAALPLTVRVTNDCLRGVENVSLTATMAGQNIKLYDDGKHGDQAANDGVFGGTVPSSMLQFGEVDIQLTASLSGYPDVEYDLHGQIKYPADVLIISDDGQLAEEDYYGTMLSRLGINYDLWDVTAQGRFPAVLLAQKPPAVLWFTGPWLGTFEEYDKNAMVAYLDGGGQLLAIGQDLLQYLMAYRGKFVKNYLHIDKQWNDVNYTYVTGIDEEPLTAGLAANLKFPFINYTDVIKPTDDAAKIWLDGRGRGAAVRFPIDYEDQSTYRVAMAAFPVEALPQDQADEFVNRSLQWFFHDHCFDTDGDGYSSGGACTGDLDCANDDPASHPGATEICDDNKDNDCNGLTDLDDPVCEGFGEDDDTSADDDVSDDDSDDDDDQTGADDDDDDDDDNGCGS